ncbi:ABC-type transport auxiliary lipoprotein family protein [Thiohalobacter thiocyanaticus]|uniref:ABC-type transport auxiliary lipoprotein component domain-containing protein n=1 Tax=Thiohalobacter thiocyanaticus TaxID=585455 RepID=A0A426QGS7_9GAMM|nr:ABC-type transport auxiliary lipoprotein family protein [Thiohalobacter thiocyanaticus]RRQ20957.1 hypothetical protein D6C00_02545 [Thiohalobacter thiocyanaticus]
MRSIVTVFSLVMALLAGGCAGPAAVPEDSYYRLARAEPASRLNRPLLTGGLVVAVVETPALYQDRAIVYRTAEQPLQLRRHHYHYWSESPPRLLQAYLVDYLTATGLADRVLEEDYAGAARYRLHTRLERFDQIRGAQGAGVEVALAFELHDRDTGERLAVSELSRTLSVDTGDASMHTTVELFHSALEQMSAEWLQRLADARP